MTNFEWLVKNGILEDFLFDVSEKTAKENYLKYHIQFYGDRDYRKEIADWLQAERKIGFYVRYDDVIELIKGLAHEGRITATPAQSICDELPFIEIKELEND